MLGVMGFSLLRWVEVSEKKIIRSPRCKSLANSIARPSASQAVRVTLSAGTPVVRVTLRVPIHPW